MGGQLGHLAALKALGACTNKDHWTISTSFGKGTESDIRNVRLFLTPRSWPWSSPDPE